LWVEQGETCLGNINKDLVFYSSVFTYYSYSRYCIIRIVFQRT